MRSLRWLLLVAMVLIAAAVFSIYRAQRKTRQSQRRAVPASVPLDTKTIAPDWEWTQSADGHPAVKITARSMKQSADGSRAELERIELRIYTKDGQHYDRVKSAYAQLTTTDHKLYSPGDAEITLEVPVQGDPPHPLTSITASGINFDSESGQAVTDKHVSFTFEQGTGTCDGATYEPNHHILTLRNNVAVNLRGKGPGGMPMKVETAQLTWNEVTGLLNLSPWARLTRDQTRIEAGESVVQLMDNEVQWIDGQGVHGTDQRPGRQLAYSADSVRVTYNDQHQIQLINGVGHAKLLEHGTGSDTSISGDKVDLGFVDNKGQSALSIAVVTGNGYLETKPIPDPKGDTADTKVLKADGFSLQMQPGGKDLQQITTRSPGTLEFLPNQPAHHRRLLEANQMLVVYGAKNEIQSFHATGTPALAASTQTFPSEEDRRKKKGNLATAFTNSKSIDATFDDKGQLKLMKQNENFHYTEGDRRAQADNATLENATNMMDLDKNARILDASGSTSGDHIQINQNTGDFDARGHVSTTHLPEEKKSESAMLDKDEPTLGTADHVTSANRNHLIHYSGNAVVWQTSNRIQGDRVDIDRDKKSIIADGKVVTQFEDKPKEDAAPAAKPLQPTFTIVKSPHMVYTDADRLANYSGGVDFWRPALTVKSSTLKAYLNPDDSDADSRIHHALGDGNVEIVQFAPDRQRVGKSEHAEYYTEEGKVILTGGEPKLDDSKRGNTKGDKLTWFTNDDKLVIEGAPEKKGQSHIRKKTS
jgi:lipopolysaccharide export system protein LptA